MRSAGTVLKDARIARKKTLAQISRRTRIKQKFLTAIENSDWESLPNFSIAQGFSRAYALNVGVDPGLIAALVRRDFPEEKHGSIGKGELVTPHSIWTPQATIIATFLISLAILLIYLGGQYLQFSAPPKINILKTETFDNVVRVSGKTSPSATLEVNGRPVLIEENGSFSTEVEMQNLINSAIYIQATSRTGKKSTVTKKIE